MGYRLGDLTSGIAQCLKQIDVLTE